MFRLLLPLFLYSRKKEGQGFCVSRSKLSKLQKKGQRKPYYVTYKPQEKYKVNLRSYDTCDQCGIKNYCMGLKFQRQRPEFYRCGWKLCMQKIFYWVLLGQRKHIIKEVGICLERVFLLVQISWNFSFEESIRS